MSRTYHSDTPWLAPLFTVEQVAEAVPLRVEKTPSPFLCWLERYFANTPEERMQDEYIAYWH